MAKFSRTVNPLHFEDFEPHRFEDLVRQLAYDFRAWHSIEATGRLGADEGIDIRATERLAFDPVLESSDDSIRYQERLWVVQCKREKSIGPKKVKDILAAAISENSAPPHGFIIAGRMRFLLSNKRSIQT